MGSLSSEQIAGLSFIALWLGRLLYKIWKDARDGRARLHARADKADKGIKHNLKKIDEHLLEHKFKDSDRG